MCAYDRNICRRTINISKEKTGECLLWVCLCTEHICIGEGGHSAIGHSIKTICLCVTHTTITQTTTIAIINTQAFLYINALNIGWCNIIKRQLQVHTCFQNSFYLNDNRYFKDTDKFPKYRFSLYFSFYQVTFTLISNFLDIYSPYKSYIQMDICYNIPPTTRLDFYFLP